MEHPEILSARCELRITSKPRCWLFVDKPPWRLSDSSVFLFVVFRYLEPFPIHKQSRTVLTTAYYLQQFSIFVTIMTI